MMNYQTHIEIKKAKDPNTPPEVLHGLAYHTHHSVRYWVAGNPNTPVSALEKLVNDEIGSYDPSLYLIAKNPNTPAFLLEKLIVLHTTALNCYIEANPNTTQRLKNYINAINYVTSNRH